MSSLYDRRPASVSQRPVWTPHCLHLVVCPNSNGFGERWRWLVLNRAKLPDATPMQGRPVRPARRPALQFSASAIHGRATASTPLGPSLAASQASNVAHTKIWIIIVNLERHHHRRGRLEAACAVSASRPQRGTPALLIARSCSALCALSLLLCTWAHNPSIAQIQIPDQLPAPSSHPAPPHAVPRANAP